MRTSIENFTKALTTFGFYGALGPVIGFFVAALLIDPSNDRPSGQAGYTAAVIALLTGFMILLESERTDMGSFRKVRKLCIGICVMASAYLWTSSEAGVHPRDPGLLIGLSYIVFWVLYSASIGMLVLAAAPNIMGEGPSSEDRN